MALARFIKYGCWSCKHVAYGPFRCKYDRECDHTKYEYNDAIINVESVPGNERRVTYGGATIPLHVIEFLTPLEVLVLEMDSHGE